MITKSDLIKGALQHLAVEGLLMQPMAQDQQATLQHLDDFAATYAAMGQDVGYLQPLQYGTSLPEDDSGVDVGLVAPVKVMLAAYIAAMFGKQLDPAKTAWAEKMMNQQLVSVVPCRYPTTLPTGSGNYDGTDDTFFKGGLPV